MNEHIYKIKYTIQRGEFTARDVAREENSGLTDKLILTSIINHRDGSRSEMIVSSDGNGHPLSSDEMFKSWVAMTHRIAQDNQLGNGRRAFANAIIERIREVFKNEIT